MSKFYRCSCYSEVLAVDMWGNAYDGEDECVWDDEICFAIYTQNSYTFIERLRHCWRILRRGEPYADQVILYPATAKQLARDLIDMIEEKEIEKGDANAAEEEQAQDT